MIALLLCVAASFVGFTRALAFGADALGGWGLVAALLLFGFGLALLFTAVYDGPAALRRLARRGPPGHHRS